MSLSEQEFRAAHPLSATQIDTALLCERKWAYLKLAGLKPDSNRFATTGTDVHSVLEEWQSTGKPVDLSTDAGKIASAGLKLLPQPGTHKAEHEFRFDTGVAVYHGYMDLRGPPTFPIQTVWDHKTTSNFRWMKTPELLRRDPQAMLYGTAVLHEAKEKGITLGSGVLRVELNWLYYLSDPKRPKSRKVQLHIVPDDAPRLPICPDEVDPKHFGIMPHSELTERFDEIQQTAKRLLQLYRDKPKPEELPPNAAACSAYGGCPFEGKPCNLSTRERFQSMEAHEQAKTMTLAEKIRNKMAGKKPEESAPSKTETTTASAPAAKIATPEPRKPDTVINPPERAQGSDPDEPARVAAKNTPSAAGYGRTELAALAMQAIVARGTHATNDAKYAVKVAADSVQLADALLAALGK